MRIRNCTLIIVLLLAAAAAQADDEAPAPAPAYAFDAENLPLSEALEKAKAAKKLVFIDFYLPG